MVCWVFEGVELGWFFFLVVLVMIVVLFIVVVVGGVVGGMFVVIWLCWFDEFVYIVVFECGFEVLYVNCGFLYYVGGVIEDC